MFSQLLYKYVARTKILWVRCYKFSFVSFIREAFAKNLLCARHHDGIGNIVISKTRRPWPDGAYSLKGEGQQMKTCSSDYN